MLHCITGLSIRCYTMLYYFIPHYTNLVMETGCTLPSPLPPRSASPDLARSHSHSHNQKHSHTTTTNNNDKRNTTSDC